MIENRAIAKVIYNSTSGWATPGWGKVTIHLSVDFTIFFINAFFVMLLRVMSFSVIPFSVMPVCIMTIDRISLLPFSSGLMHEQFG